MGASPSRLNNFKIVLFVNLKQDKGQLKAVFRVRARKIIIFI